MNKARAILNKRVVIGLNYYDQENNLIESTEMHGKIISVSASAVQVELEGQHKGETFSLPRDLRAFRKAEPGVYTLKSTGEEVVDPDYTTSWNITKPPEEKKP